MTAAERIVFLTLMRITAPCIIAGVLITVFLHGDVPGTLIGIAVMIVGGFFAQRSYWRNSHWYGVDRVLNDD